jgi:hypothetical protein
MSDVIALLSRCRAFGAEFLPDPGGKLKVQAPAPLPKELQTELKRHKAELLELLRQRKADSPYRVSYHRAAEAIREECYEIDSLWLIEAHPELWERMVTLDEVLSQLERAETAAEAYQQVTMRLVACVTEAKQLYKREHAEQEAVQ